MGNARSIFAVATPIAAALLISGCTPPRPGTGAAVVTRCLVADTTTAGPDTVYAIVDTARNSTIDCERRAFEPGNTPVAITITPPPGADLRDVLEGRAMPARRPDVVVTRDPALIDFARRSGQYLVEPLPWNTTHVLATAISSAAAVPDAAARDALARDAVGDDARGAAEPFQWLTNDTCVHTLNAPRGTPSSVVAYSSGDGVARAIAERIVSLAGSRERPAWLPPALARTGTTFRAAAVATDSMTHALTSGRAAAAVIAIARDPSTSCGTRDNAPVPRGAIPLVDARPHVIVRRGSGAAFIVGVDGALHFVKRGTP